MILKKNLLSRNYKYYAADPGLRRGYKVYTGKVDDLEADYDGITKTNVVDWLLKEK